MKSSICIIAHYSKEFRANGIDLMNRCLQSFENVKVPHVPIVIDNGSEESLEVPEGVVLHRIESQYEGGWPYAYNQCIRVSLEQGCDLIHILNDDIVLNETFQPYEKSIRESDAFHNGVFGPRLNDSRHMNSYLRSSDELPVPDKELEHKDDRIVGAFLSFSAMFCKRFHQGKEIWEVWNYDMKPPLGGAECQAFQDPLRERGARLFIKGTGWFHHDAIGGWEQFTSPDYKHSRW